jgi:DNA-binding beta-propeller fold protein YncE
VLVGVLSLTEVPATVLISPLRPQPLIPMLMGWVHMLRYDDMIEGSLLLMAMAFTLSLVAAALIGIGLRIVRRGMSIPPSPTMATVGLSAIVLVGAAGCRDGKAPEEVWLETGNAPGQVVYPRAITYSPKDDTFFIVDRLARVQHITSEGKPLGEWRMPDWRIGKPVGVSVGPDGNVYVPDTHYDRVIVYSPGGKEIRRWGERGDKPGQFIWPTDVAFDKAGNCYVSEYGGNDRIQVFAPDGSFLRSFGKFGNGDGEFSRPQSMVIDGEFVYVTDACNHRMVVFKTDGTFVRNFGELGSGLGQFRFPWGLDEDAKGRLVVCEFGNNRLQLVDKETGKGLAVWGVPGRDPGQLAYPWAVALDHKGRVMAVDSGNNRVQVFEF